MENSGQNQAQDPSEEAIRRLQRELDGSERRFRTIVDAVPQIIWENDPDGKAIYFNRRWYEYSGLSYEESAGPGWPVLVHAEDGHSVDEWRQSFLSGQPFEGEGRLRRADGIYEWHLLRNLPLRDKDGGIRGWFGTATNVNELKNMGFLLGLTSERLHAILEAATDFAIITMDKEGYIIDWNSGAQRIFGYERREAIGKSVAIIFTPEDRYAGISGQEIARAGETGQSMDERWHMRKDGSRFFMSGVMTPIRAHTMHGYVKVARDITDRKLTEEALFLAEQRNSLTIQSTQMGEWDWDILSDQVKRNEYARKLFGLDDKGDTGNGSFFARVYAADEEMVRQQVEVALEGLNIYQAEFRILRADNGRVTWVSSYGRVVRHTDNRPSRMIGVIYDITARKMLEKHKDDFISVASHELKTPVTSIKGYSQVLLANLRQARDTTNAALLAKLNRQVDRLTKLLHTLLDSTSILEGKLKLRPEVFDLNKLVEEQVAEIQLISPFHRLVWQPSVIPLIHADMARIRQVVTNLLSNAVKYSPKNSEIIISSRDDMDGARVEVRDFGPGIAPDQQQHIFQRYYRVNDGVLPNSQSLGLGLYISMEIIKQHKGSMGVESVDGKGSTFYFKLSYS